ncbi:tripartite motif-containing protein 45 isoform X1 [Podarcis raffonei]|uniref:tripartite motif-containing protein 45 isoform X1 n=1 Tax=Podarcis raffonei TaxID=65483 RepID=UPI00232945CA|nr:tripartite motif-containing protein 45 isoform X1 [Podarcis raffonei]
MSNTQGLQEEPTSVRKALPEGKECSRSKCPLCAQLFSAPKILPCLHTFCTACLEQLEPFSDLGLPGEDSDSSSEGPCLQSCRPPPSPLLSLLCPVCDAEVDLPPGGIKDLTTDHMALKEVLLETLQGEGLGLACDLCVDGEAVKHCQACRVCLCQFCCQAHKRQKKTAAHPVVELQDLKGYTHIEKPIQCLLHPSEELTLFCEQCDTSVCQECVVGTHRQHPYNFTSNVIHKHGDSIRELLKITQLNMRTLEGALSRIEEVGSALSTHVEAVAREICAFADGYVKAVEEHRDRLLKFLNELKVQRESLLHLQKAQLLQLLLDMQTGVEFTEHLLTNGSDLEILLTKGVVENRLSKLTSVDCNIHPLADDRIYFSPQKKAGVYHGYEIFGAVLNKAAHPAKCVLQGADLGSTPQNEPAGFTLVCKDASDEQVDRGGEPVRVSIFHKDRKDCVIKASVTDNQDGTYHISYIPEEPGKYKVCVFVRGQHVQGSPFTMIVKNKFRPHRGVFHCCTFCSSGGQKAAQCACAGVMPGGYQGCGHGHKGHPGAPHWSCCGSVAEASECSTVPSGETLGRSPLRTVVL